MRLIIDTWCRKDCTIGVLSYGNFQCFTLELKWNDNKQNISCIPEGVYQAFKRKSNKNGDVVELKGVPDRTYIQIHKGNFTYSIEGCILPGDGIKDIDNDNVPDVTNSAKTLKRLLDILPNELEVEIKRTGRYG